MNKLLIIFVNFWFATFWLFAYLLSCLEKERAVGVVTKPAGAGPPGFEVAQFPQQVQNHHGADPHRFGLLTISSLRHRCTPTDPLLRIEATMSLCPSPRVGVCRHAYPSGCSCCTYYKLQKDMLKTTVTSPEPYWNSDWTEMMTQKKKRHITHLSDSKQCFKSLMSLSGFPSLLAWSLTSRRNMEAVSVQCIWSMAMAFF